MSACLRRAMVCVGLVVWLTVAHDVGAQQEVPQPAPVAPDTLRAAERLFELPAYRELATRQLYRALASLPEDRYQASLDALQDPQVIGIVRGVIVRSMAQAYTVAELEFLARMLATDEGRSIVAKEDLLQSLLGRELLAAAIAHPELAPLFTSP